MHYDNYRAMDKPFEISFDFPVAHANFTIPLKATAQLHHSEPYYVIDYFLFEKQDAAPTQLSLLPRVEIKYIKDENRGTWVHTNSGRESLLSQAIGKAIEKSGFFTR